jgi:hypothetical protein
MRKFCALALSFGMWASADAQEFLDTLGQRLTFHTAATP